MNVRFKSGLKGGDAATHDITPNVKNERSSSVRRSSQAATIKNTVAPNRSPKFYAQGLINASSKNK